jgi:hypothetical protein
MRNVTAIAWARVVFTAVLAPASALVAQTPGTEFTYQGRLDNSGQPAAGPHDLRFSLWLSPTDSDSPIGSVICKDHVPITDGLFTVPLDFGLNVFVGFPVWMEIEARADTTPGNCASGSFTPLSPRQPLKPAPYAIWATTAQTAGLRLPFDGTSSAGVLLHLTSTTTGQNTTTGFFENYSTGNNSRALTAYANGSSGATYGVYAQSNSPAGIGVYGKGIDNAGVSGLATGALSSCAGGYFESLSDFGYGVRAVASATSGPNVGIYASSASNSGKGMLATAPSTSGQTHGVYGSSNSTSGVGVEGVASASSGVANGVVGRTLSPSGYGVFGVSSSTTSGAGVYGRATYGGGPSSPIGVLGEVIGGIGGAASGVKGVGYPYGVYGVSQQEFGTGVEGYNLADTGPGYGVRGRVDSPAAYAVYSFGNFGASGTKAFRIDHPDDPTNKYLLHYAAESPEVINFYRGVVRLDGSGEAVVELPKYFARINRSPSYQLTAMDAPMPMLHVADGIDETALDAAASAFPGEAVATCTFRIAGGQSGARVSWEVKAVRNDRWIRSHAVQVEPEKEGCERGKYQHPELYDQPPEMGVKDSQPNDAVERGSVNRE